MPRAIVYDTPSVQRAYRELRESADGSLGVVAPQQRRKLRRKAEQQVATAPAQNDVGAPRDDYAARIAKYVPVELITLTTLAFAAFEPKDTMVWVFVAIGALLNAAYWFVLAIKGKEEARPRWFSYVLSAVAYFLWAVATVAAVGAELGANTPTQQTFFLALAAFAVPGLDIAFENIDRKGR